MLKNLWTKNGCYYFNVFLKKKKKIKIKIKINRVKILNYKKLYVYYLFLYNVKIKPINHIIIS